MKKFRYIIYFYIVFLLLYIKFDVKIEPVEKTDVIAGFGYDMTKNGDSITYNIAASIYNFHENKSSSIVYLGNGNSIGESRQDRNRKTDKTFLIGLEKAYLIKEDFACYGIRNIIDILFTTPQVNDMGIVAVTKENTEDILSLKIEGYPSVADYIQSLVNNSKNYNFFVESYKLIDVYVRLDGEGRSITLPYLEKSENAIKLSGAVLFKKDKMVAKVDMEEAKFMNMIKLNSTKGMISVQNNPKEYIDYYATANRKVKCYKEGDKYSFIIDLSLKGDIVVDEMYTNNVYTVDQKKEIEKMIGENVKKECYSFLDKMKNEYKVDCINLGAIACGKYGRNTGVDWDYIVCNSDIKVNVNVTIDRFGRGNY